MLYINRLHKYKTIILSKPHVTGCWFSSEVRWRQLLEEQPLKCVKRITLFWNTESGDSSAYAELCACVCALYFADMQYVLPLLTGIVLRWHGPGQDPSEGLQPLPLLPLLLAHEDKLSLRRVHHDATLPLVSTSMLWDGLLHRVTVALSADENDP